MSDIADFLAELAADGEKVTADKDDLCPTLRMHCPTLEAANKRIEALEEVIAKDIGLQTDLEAANKRIKELEDEMQQFVELDWWHSNGEKP